MTYHYDWIFESSSIVANFNWIMCVEEIVPYVWWHCVGGWCVCLRCKERRILIRLLSIFNDLFTIPSPLSSKHNQAKTKKIKILSPFFCFYISPFGDVKRIAFCPFFCLCVREWWWLWYLSPKRIKVLLSTQQLHSHADRNYSSPTNNDILDMSLLHWQKKFIFEKFDLNFFVYTSYRTINSLNCCHFLDLPFLIAF